MWLSESVHHPKYQAHELGAERDCNERLDVFCYLYPSFLQCLLLIDISKDLYMSISGYAHMSVSSHRSQKRKPDALELELWAPESHLTWKMNLGPLKEQYMLLTMESSFQPLLTTVYNDYSPHRREMLVWTSWETLDSRSL